MEIPTWADEQLSKDLPVIRSRGEGQHLEYKERFPQNTDKLAQEIAIEESISEELKEVASSLEEVASFRLTLGCGQKLNEQIERAKEKLFTLKKAKIDSIQLSDDSKKQVREIIVMTSRKLGDLVDRSEQLAEAGKIEDLQTEASELGFQLLRVAQYNIDDFGNGIKDKLTSIGRELHLVETMPLYMDGGKSLKAILDRIKENSSSLTKLVDKFKK